MLSGEDRKLYVVNCRRQLVADCKFNVAVDEGEGERCEDEEMTIENRKKERGGDGGNCDGDGGSIESESNSSSSREGRMDEADDDEGRKVSQES